MVSPSQTLVGSSAGEALNWQGCGRTDVSMTQGRGRSTSLHQLSHKAIINRSRASPSLWEDIYSLQLLWVMAIDNRFFICVFGIWKNPKAQRNSSFFYALQENPQAESHSWRPVGCTHNSTHTTLFQQENAINNCQLGDAVLGTATN